MRKKVVSPAHRRAAAQQVVLAGLCSQRVACRFLRLARSTYGYRGRPPTTAEQQLRKRLQELSLEHPRYGYRRIAALLRQEDQDGGDGAAVACGWIERRTHQSQGSKAAMSWIGT
ncbi:MAG: hypothetical protein WBS33_14705 [Verrucomicrobiia bacterium]